MKANFNNSVDTHFKGDIKFLDNKYNRSYNNTICNLIYSSKCEEDILENMDDNYSQSESSLNVILKYIY